MIAPSDDVLGQACSAAAREMTALIAVLDIPNDVATARIYSLLTDLDRLVPDDDPRCPTCTVIAMHCEAIHTLADEMVTRDGPSALMAVDAAWLVAHFGGDSDAARTAVNWGLRAVAERTVPEGLHDAGGPMVLGVLLLVTQFAAAVIREAYRRSQARLS